MRKQFDSGTHKFDQPFTIRGDNAVLEGAGTNETTLLFRDCPAFNLDMPDGKTPVIRDMTIKTDQQGKHDAVTLKCTDASHYYGTGPQIENICITGNNVATDYWRRGLDITNGWWSKIRNVTIYGCSTRPFSSLTGIILRGNCVGVKMSSTDIFWVGDGLEVTGSCEGIRLTACDMVGVRSGIYWHTPRGEPLLSVSQCHFDAKLFGIYAVNLIQADITGNLFYLNEQLYDPAGVWLNNGSDHRVKDNTFKILNYSHKTSYGIIGQGISLYELEPNLFGQHIDHEVVTF